MEQKLPVIDIIRQSYQQTFSYRKGLLVTVVASIIMAGIAFLLFLPLMSASDGEMKNPLLSLIAIILIIGVILTGLGWIFNYWVRYGALGADRVLPSSFGASIGPAAITGLKLLIIGIFLGIIAVIIFLIGSVFGLAGGLSDLNSILEAGGAELIATFGVIYLVVFGVSCGVYSAFSANLTQTALGTDKEEVGEPHVLEFAVVLFAIYVILYIPVLLLQLVAPDAVAVVLDLVASILIAALIPVAHGLRYDWQRQVYAGDNRPEG